MPLQATSGAASYDAFGGGVPVEPVYIEQIFSTWLYTGNGSTQTITNGIDLSTKGGLVWIKARNAVEGNTLFDTARGVNTVLQTQNTDASANYNNSLTAFNTTGFSLGTNRTDPSVNYASWTFRKQPKFFDVVTWSGDGTGNRAIPHSLGSMPSFFPIKQTNGGESWWTYQRSVTSPNANWWRNYGILNGGNAFDDWGDNSGLYQAPDANNLYIGSWYNASGKTYIAYLFAHNAGGFGLTGTDNVISCGSYTGNVTVGNAVTLGYEPQWVLVKRATGGTGSWYLYDTMRGMTANAGGNTNPLNPNLSDAEGVNNDGIAPSATGFTLTSTSDVLNGSGFTYIYIAIRRGPMKVPTTGTSVFQPVAYTGNGTSQSVTTGITGDLTYIKYRTDAGASTFFTDRLRGSSKILESNSSVAEDTSAQHLTSFNQLGFSVGNNGNVNASGGTFISETFKRAPSFFDVVCYTGTGSATTVAHNLGVAPEFIQVKCRSNANGWYGYSTSTGNTKTISFGDIDSAQVDSTAWNNTSPTSSTFTVGTSNSVNGSARTYVAYLFATCAGVSKVGSYTGNGTTQTIDCGFGAGGARFVLIKRTDSTGNWYVYDTARGMTVLTDPYLLLNSTAAETATLGSVTTVSTGFAVNAAIVAAINTNAASYIFLAVA